MFGEQNLLELETALKNQENNIRINIHLRLNRNIKNWATMANNMLINNLEPDIMFGKNSVMQPHITILIGELINANNLQTVLNITKKIVNGCGKCINLKFKNLSFSDNENWAFLWAEENDAINKITKELIKGLSPFVNITNFGNPHITLAKAKNLKQNKNVLNDLSFPSHTSCFRVDIALCGKGGTVFKVIDSFSLI